MSNNSAEQFFPRTRSASSESSRRRPSKVRTPSSVGYFVTAVVASLALFFALWWIFVSGGDEAPWIPAGLAASVVLLVALSAREVLMRRAWTRYLLEQGIHEHSSRHTSKSSDGKRTHSTSLLTAAVRSIQKQSVEADMPGASPEMHLEVFHICRDYMGTADEALQSNSLPAEKRMAIRSGQERVRTLQRHHLLTWAREASRSLTYEAQQRSRTSEKIETANKALQCLDSALKVYPDEVELNQSKLAIREFIASVKVAHWVELAERSAFKGHYRRAIERYKDALFYLNRETVNDEIKTVGAKRIAEEIEVLQSRIGKKTDRVNESEENEGGEQ